MSTVAVGMSGGVDSCMAAYLLKEQGYDVAGVFLRLRQGICAEDEKTGKRLFGQHDLDDAKTAAKELGIPFYAADAGDGFKEHVVDYFVDEYTHGRTPNPCIACNRYVKWGALLSIRDDIGADYVATGHYARVTRLQNGRYTLRRAADPKKDQTYALCGLTQGQLEATVFPLGDYRKEEVTALAERLGLHAAERPESQDICFVPDGDYAAFIESNSDIKIPRGNFVSADGEILGVHKGITHYTVGQRKGLGLALGEPAYVLGIRPDTNEVVVGTRQESFKRAFRADRLNFMSAEDIKGRMRLFAKVRYNHKGAWCTVEKTGEDELSCIFDEAQFAVTPGQAAVFYDGEYVLAGGIIEG